MLDARVMQVCSDHTSAGTIWQVDAALRPEGKAGPLVRSLAAYTTYYQRWAATWEFQALLRARPVGGDPDLGQAFMGQIYRARDVRLDRTVAIKLLPEEFSGRADRRQRFQHAGGPPLRVTSTGIPGRGLRGSLDVSREPLGTRVVGRMGP